MADKRELDQVPAESSPSDLMVVVRNLAHSKSPIPNTLASTETYKMLLLDRPGKFNETQVQFKRGAGDEHGSCGTCFHFYVGKAAKHQTCEIFRPADDSNIEPQDRCRFFTQDGKTFPFLSESEE